MANINKNISLPVSFTEQYVKCFLKDIEFIFHAENKEIPGIVCDTMKTNKIDLLGEVLLYKFLEFTIVKHCFSAPTIHLHDNKYLNHELEKYGFKSIVDSYVTYEEKGQENYNFKYKEEDNFFIAPMLLDRESDKGLDLKDAKKIRSYYQNIPKADFIALQCLGEVSSNFIAHATEDTKSVLAAKGNKEQLEIVCADNGEGIISTLKPVSKNKTSVEILRSSIERGVTSKKDSFHMGHGLWLINEFVTKSGGKLDLISEGYYLTNKKGKIKIGEIPYWKGTIIYVQLNISQSENIWHDIKCQILEENDN